MTLKKFGFFRRMPKDEAVRELNRLRSDCARVNESLVLAYLKGGTQLFLVPAIATDLLSDQRRLIAPPHIYTDGEWAWSAEALYYIEQYHIDIPTDLRVRMAEYAWVCPAVADTSALQQSYL